MIVKVINISECIQWLRWTSLIKQKFWCIKQQDTCTYMENSTLVNIFTSFNNQFNINV